MARTKELYMSEDLAKIVSDYSGLNNLVFPPTTIQILNALVAYIEDINNRETEFETKLTEQQTTFETNATDSYNEFKAEVNDKIIQGQAQNAQAIANIQQTVDNYEVATLPNYTFFNTPTSASSTTLAGVSTLILNGSTEYHNSNGNTEEGEYHVNLKTSDRIKVNSSGMLYVHTTAIAYNNITFTRVNGSGNGIASIGFNYIGSDIFSGENLFNFLWKISADPLYGTRFYINATGKLVNNATLYDIIGIRCVTMVVPTNIQISILYTSLDGTISEYPQEFVLSSEDDYEISFKNVFYINAMGTFK